MSRSPRPERRTTPPRGLLAASAAALAVALALAATARGEAQPAAMLDAWAAARAGIRFTSAARPAAIGDAAPGSAPTVAVAADGRRAVAWVTAPDGGSDGRLRVSVVDTAGRALAAPVELRDPLGPIEPHGEAPPKVAFGPHGAVYALWVVGKEVPGRRFPMSALRFARSADGGRTWSAPVSVTDMPQPFGSFNFHALQAARGDTVYAAWLDARDGRSATYLTRSTDGGRTWAPNVRITPPGGESCPCCRTAVAAGRGDTVYAAWRGVARRTDRTTVREVVVARSADGGRTWAAPVRAQRDGWVFDACPHAGPSLAVDAAGGVHVAWWSGREGAAGVFYARSDDGAASFGPPAPLGVAEHSMPAHVQLAVAAAGEGRRPAVVAAWDDGTRRVPRVLVRVSRDGGRTFRPAAAASRTGAATFPVLAAGGDRLVLAWTAERAAAHGTGEAPGHGHAARRDPSAPHPLPRVGQRTVLVREAVLD
jgi:hypothetical protein